MDRIDRGTVADRALALRGSALEGRPVASVSPERIAGRTLAEAVVADRDVPARSTATMDGFAFDAAADYPLGIDGDVRPEDDPDPLDPGTATRIATGAPLPEGATAVLPSEAATVEGDRLSGPPVEPWTNVYRQGANVAAGETVLAAGTRLAPRHAALLADLGVDAVPVHDRFSAAVLATGTEIHEGRSPDRDSAMLAGLVRAWGHDATPAGSVPDEYDRVEERIAALADEHDVVVTSGGTGRGPADHVAAALDALGDLRVRGVRIRCGKPVCLAALPEHDAVALAFPGKPVGAHTAALAVGRPFFRGERALPTVPATLAADVGLPEADFEYWVPVVLGSGPDGDAGDGRRATPLGHPDSPTAAGGPPFDPRILSSATRTAVADGVLVTETERAAGDRVRVVPYGALV